MNRTILRGARYSGRRGFQQEVISEQTFNVISVSRAITGAKTGEVHYEGRLPITEKAVVKNYVYKRADIIISQTLVEFTHYTYTLADIRNGLDGMGLVIEVYGENCDRDYEFLELYTDTPSAWPDHEMSITPKELRERARQASRRAGH